MASKAPVLRWFLSSLAATAAAVAAASATMADPKSCSDPDRAPADPHHTAGDPLLEGLQRIDLKQDPEDDADNKVDAEEGKEEREGEGEGEGGKAGGERNTIEAEKAKDEGDGWGVEEELKEEREGEGEGDFVRSVKYPVRPEAEDCSYYMRTGNCKFGSNCKFNHPVVRKNQDKVKEKEESRDKSSQAECKFYLKTGSCKFGKACRYNHTRPKISATPFVELNFLGLPIRPGEKECPFYMRTGSCKYAANCRFNHPDPTGAGDPPPEYINGGSAPLPSRSPLAVASWSTPGSLNESTPFIPIMYSPTHGVSSHNTEWNGYQYHLNTQGSSMHSTPAFFPKSPMTEGNVYAQHQQTTADEFPERPGQPECSYFLKTGDCKFKSNCKYHHPKDRVLKSPSVELSDKGLPLRPDQNICSYYSRYGICKFGPACKFDHPINLAPSNMSVLDRLPSVGDSVSRDGSSADVIRNADDGAIQQSV